MCDFDEMFGDSDTLEEAVSGAYKLLKKHEAIIEERKNGPPECKYRVVRIAI